MITPLPNAWEEKPGSATLPFFGEYSRQQGRAGVCEGGGAEGLTCGSETATLVGMV